MFRDCTDLNFKEYLDVIKEPIALDIIKEKLDRDNPEMVRFLSLNGRFSLNYSRSF